ncbi:MAG: TIM barrel protein [Planctomycetes bacterium]|nr:TIM barrel protein [Planctomycetota bacterium]
MRLAGPIYAKYETPEEWAAAVAAKGYRAANAPRMDIDGQGGGVVQAFADAAKKNDIVIAECGAWSNPLSNDAKTAQEAMDKCVSSLALAEELGARCCVNISGSRGEKWDGPCAEDLTPETFDLIVETVRAIIDAVKPTRTYYTLETMPWMYPDSVDSYELLLKAIDRKGFAVHFDPVNLVNCPSRYFNTDKLITEFVDRLGGHIRSCHLKDTSLAMNLTTCLTECRPGTGGLDYPCLLRTIDKLDKDTPVYMEHLPSEEEYDLAAEYIRGVAKNEGVTL